MTVRYHNWQRDRPRDPFNTCSPNLRLILAYCGERWGLTNLGCYGRRPIRGGTAWSSHSFGAAQDMSYRNGPDRKTIETEVIPFLVDNADALGLQRVHDYWAQRYWQHGRGWIGRPPGARNDHLHIECTPQTWGWYTPIADRLAGKLPAPAAPAAVKYPGTVTRRGSKATARVRMIQTRLRELGFDPGNPDGKFGPRTHAATMRFQQSAGLVTDGIVGRNTWAKLFDS